MPRAVAQTVDTVKYGEFDSAIYTSAMMEDVKEWLLDENVPTEWDVLLAIRQQHAA